MSRPRATIKQEVIDHLRYLIDSGKAVPGDQLPTESQLTERFDTSRPTVRGAYDVLVSEGLVEKRATIGYFVRVRTETVWDMAGPGAGAVDGDGWLNAVRDGYEGSQTVRVEILPAAHAVSGRRLCDLLDLPADASVAGRLRVRSIARPGEELTPVELCDTYYAYDLARREVDGRTPLLEAQEIPAPVDGILSALGYPPRGAEHLLSARMPTVGEADKLKLPPGTAVQELVRIGRYGQDRRPLSVRHSVFGAGNVLRYDLTA